MGRARWIASVVGTGVVACSCLVADGLRAEEPPGRAVFEREKCGLCHDHSGIGVEAKTKSAKLEGGDLAGVTGTRESDWIASYLRREERVDGEEHRREFKGSEDDIQVLIDWLVALDAEASADSEPPASDPGAS